MKGQEDVANVLRDAFAKDPKIRADRITITMLEDTIALAGEVQSLAEKDEATFLARQIAPQFEIDNGLTVAGNRLPTDAELSRKAEELLRQEGLPDSLGVRVQRGEATLVGSAESLAVRDRAARVVGQVPGIRAVHVENVTPFRQEVVESIGPERSTVHGKVQTVGSGTPIVVDRDVADLVSAIEQKLATELQPPRADEIRVTAKNGVVRLTGFVKTAQERVRAEILARSVPGVTEVLNVLVSQDGSAGCDEALGAEVRRRLAEVPHLSPATIKVFVVGDTAYLQGEVDIPEQAMEAKRVVARVPGIAHVDNTQLRTTEKHPRSGHGPGRSVAETRGQLVSERADWDPSRPEETWVRKPKD
ncbi:MAG TPA: BON domain-containing protein [Stenomitos sp.]